jgi:hypothetical protein
MKTCTYISGPPCVGKTTVAKAVALAVGGLLEIRGDSFWVTYPHLPFKERVASANADILAALRNADEADVLCEWVPWSGTFVSDLRAMCAAQERRLLHVILTAPPAVLRHRKLDRDGDEEAGVEALPVLDRLAGHGQMLFDTDGAEPDQMAADIADWIRFSRQLQADSRER